MVTKSGTASTYAGWLLISSLKENAKFQVEINEK